MACRAAQRRDSGVPNSRNAAKLQPTLPKSDRLLAAVLLRLREQAAQAQPPSGEHAAPSPPVEWNFASAWGQFSVQVQWLRPLGGQAQPLVQVRLWRHQPYAVALARALRSLPLTAGQATVCRGLVQGHSLAQVVQQLGLAPATITEHVRKSCRALDIRSGHELADLLRQRRLG